MSPNVLADGIFILLFLPILKFKTSFEKKKFLKAIMLPIILFTGEIANIYRTF